MERSQDATFAAASQMIQGGIARELGVLFDKPFFHLHVTALPTLRFVANKSADKTAFIVNGHGYAAADVTPHTNIMYEALRPFFFG